MIFKKKYKRTEWMEGLLLAESFVKRGGSVKVETGVFEYAFGPEFYSVLVCHADSIETRISLNGGLGFESGVRDYLTYFEENKEILSKGLDK